MSWKISREGERYYVDADTMPGAQKALRLAAAAPMLLAALELIESAKDRGLGIDYARGCARAAIAKAKGESHE